MCVAGTAGPHKKRDQPMPSPIANTCSNAKLSLLQTAASKPHRIPTTPTPDARARTRAAGARPKQVRRRPVLAIPLLMAMSSSAGNNGTIQIEPVPKRRRLLDAGGPIEDDETARQKMRDADVYERGVDGVFGKCVGFDPDNVGDTKCTIFSDDDAVNPMRYFAEKGDLPMMRWLYVNGADSRDCGARAGDAASSFPMFGAALWGHLDVCKWLFQHGAARDVTRRNANGNGVTPLSVSFNEWPGNRNMSRWLILNGALCKDDDSGEIGVEIIKQDLRMGTRYSWRVKERKLLLEWANDLHRARTSFLLFLSGALSAPKHACITRRNVSPVQILGGKTGVLELISDYVGFVRGREARIIRQLTQMLPDLLASTG